MTAVDFMPAFVAFEKQLNTLCLREFPCGAGKWRESETNDRSFVISKGQKRQKKKAFDKVNKTKFAVTLTDYGAQREKTETLQEYVTSEFSPWHLDYSWSSEAEHLREIAVKSPWLIDDTFVLKHFKTLRIIDKNVTEVDDGLLKFTNLEELTLSANFIKNVSSKSLPSTLKVLELCANGISDISALCINPPSLYHLGLGYNRICFMGDYLTGDYWPCLLSLDLSHNDLGDLLDVVRKLSTLPKLRNLILQGNPLSLIPGYRGYVIDSLRKLTVLDDIRISADERHHFKGLARRREHILDEAKITLEVSYLKDVPMPEEMKNPEEQPEFPIIERTYFVQFMFLEDSGGKLDMLHSLDECTELSTLLENQNKLLQHTEVLAESVTGQSLSSRLEKNVYFNNNPDLKSMDNLQDLTNPSTDAAIPSSVFDDKNLHEETEINLMTVDDNQPKPNLIVLKTDSAKWSEDIELSWSTSLVRDDLLSLRNFFKQGMDFSVIEQTVMCYPMVDEEAEGSVAGSVAKKGKEDKSAKGDKGDKKAKGGGKEKEEKKKKKKGEPEQELRRTSPQFSTLASFHLPLEGFLEGEFEYESVFSQGGADVNASTARSLDSPEPVSKKDIKKEKEIKDKKKPLSAKKKEEKPKDNRKGSAKPKEADKKDGKKGKGPLPTTEEEEEEVPPPPLEVHVAVSLHHWKTAMASLQDEEEKTKALLK